MSFSTHVLNKMVLTAPLYIFFGLLRILSTLHLSIGLTHFVTMLFIVVHILAYLLACPDV